MRRMGCGKGEPRKGRFEALDTSARRGAVYSSSGWRNMVPTVLECCMPMARESG